MAVNKVVYGGKTLVDLTSDNVTAAKMLSGTTAHDKTGAAIAGTIATKTSSNMTVSGATVTAPAGYYASAQSKSVATATQATPSISVDSAGKITASATQTAGYVSAGTKSATKQLTTQAAQTITPGTTDKTITSGRYLTGTQTIKGDANLLAENIKSGVSIFGVQGSLESDNGGSSGDGPDNMFAVTIQFSTDNIWREIFPFKTGMTWLEFYESYCNPLIAIPNQGYMWYKIDGYYDGRSPLIYFYDMLDWYLDAIDITDSSGNFVDWDHVIQPYDFENPDSSYMASRL